MIMINLNLKLSSVALVFFLCIIEISFSQEIKFESDVINIGEINNSSNTVITIPFFNGGLLPLKLSSCSSSAHNVTCSFSNRSLSSQANSELHIEIAPEINQTDFSFNLLIKSNGKTPRKQIRIYGECSDEVHANRVDLKSNLSTISNSELYFTQADNSKDVNVIAVIPLINSTCIDKSFNSTSVSSIIETAMLEHYIIVERTNFESLLEEQKLGMSGLLFESSVVQAGFTYGAQGILFVDYECSKESSITNVKLVDCGSSKIIWSCSGVDTSIHQIIERIKIELK